MALIGGLIAVFASVLGGYVLHGGNIAVLNQPTEFLVIGGASLGSFVASHPPVILKSVMPAMMNAIKGSGVGKESYRQLLGLMASIFDTMRREGVLGIEGDLSNPHESPRFNKYPKVSHDHHLMETLTGALRLFVDGVVNAFDLERLLDTEIETHHEEALITPAAVKGMADGLPAFGIVAAVLGVVLTMQHLNEPPSVIGESVGAALVGTMLGIFLSYGLVNPIGCAIEGVVRDQTNLLKCVQAGLVSFAGGAPPAVALEFARKTIPTAFRPTSEELEEIVKEAKKS